MRILIGNDLDDSLRHKKDIRAWTQRIFWFAADHDLIILTCPPDKTFLHFVTSLTGVNPATLKFHVVPPGRFKQRMFDVHGLTDEEFLRAVAADLDEVSEIVALWPSAQVSHFAARLGLSDRWPGARFFSQNGGEVVNNKANFRAFAAACGVPTARGAVCRTLDDAVAAMNRLLAETRAVMVKQAHNGAGAGNEIVTRDRELQTDHVGGEHLYLLGPDAAAVRAYWASRWAWASADGRYAIVIEELKLRARSVYAEYACTDAGVRLREVGGLYFEKRELTRELLPLRDLAADVRTRLTTAAQKLAEFYWTLGYRGRLSADAVVTEDGAVTFTEVNARFTGSTHMYDPIAHRIVEAHRSPERSVLQCLLPSHWAVADLEEFLRGVAEVGCLYDRQRREGVIPIMPAVAGGGGGSLLFCIVYGTSAERQALFQKLDDRFGVDACVGVPALERKG